MFEPSEYQRALNLWGRRKAEAAGKWPNDTTIWGDVELDVDHYRGYYWTPSTWDMGGVTFTLSVPLGDGSTWQQKWDSNDGPDFVQILREIIACADEADQ